MLQESLPLELLQNASVYAPEPLGHMNILVAGGEIVWMGSEDPDLPTSFPIQVMDLEGRRVIPGLIDGHVHVTGGGGEAGHASRVSPVPLSRITRGGVTTVVGVLGTDDIVRTPGELLARCRALVEQGLDAYCHTGGYHVPPVTLTGSIRSDIVHLDRVIGVGEIAISDHRSSQPTLDELLRIASETHVAGLMTNKAGIVHLHVGDGERGLELVRQALDTSEIPARVFNPTHVNRRRALFEEAIELMGRGVHIDITAFPVGPEEDAWSAEDALGQILDRSDREGGEMASRVTVSTDGGGCLPTFDAEGRVAHMDVGEPAALAQTLKTLLESGRDLEQVLPAFTSNPAALLRFGNKGRLRQGGAADLVVLDDQHNVCDVMIRGVWHLREGQPRIVEALSWDAAEKGSAE